jgi:hypothetical protein
MHQTQATALLTARGPLPAARRCQLGFHLHAPLAEERDGGSPLTSPVITCPG